MKKLLLPLFVFMILTGCSLNVSDIDNTPTKKVEAYLNNYQSLSEDVLEDLDVVVARENDFTDDDRKEYTNIMKKHFENLDYTVKEETVNGDNATVEVEIEVTDFYKVNTESEKYLEDHKDEFNNDEGIYDAAKYIKYRLEKLEKAKDTVKYTIYFDLTKNDSGEWELNEVSEADEEKILGMYAY